MTEAGIHDILKDGKEVIIVRSEAQKDADRRYERKTYALLGVKVKKETAAQFKSLAAENGLSTAAQLRELVERFLASPESYKGRE